MKDRYPNKINIEKLSVPIEGMTCASCVSRVEKAISSLDGVTDVVVNLATEKATFSIANSKIKMEEIKKVVEDAGYKINLSSVEDANQNYDANRKEEKKSGYEIELKKDFLLALILTIPVFILSMSQMWGGLRELIPLSNIQLNKILLIFS